MANRPIIYDEEQGRTFDVLEGWRDFLVALGYFAEDVNGSTIGVVSGLVATPTTPASLSINLSAGRVYQQAVVDGSSYGALPADSTIVQQQGYADAQQVLLSTAGLSAGQSRWALIEAQFNQADAVAPGDPTGGLLLYYNSSNPSQPFQGPGNDGQIQNTTRNGVCAIRVTLGAAATTGSEVPPNPDAGWLPLYLIDLTFGQTQILSNQILVAGPSVGVGVPNNYANAPFLAGLLNAHHGGIAGQAPKINLAAEVQGILPLLNLLASSATGGGLPVMKLFAGNPNTNVAGNASVNGASDFCWDTTNKVLYVCTTTGNAASAVWTSAVQSSQTLGTREITTSTALAIALNDQVLFFNRTTSVAALTATLPANPTPGQTFILDDQAGNFNAAPVKIVVNTVPAGQTIAGAVPDGSASLNVDFSSTTIRYNATSKIWAIER